MIIARIYVMQTYLLLHWHAVILSQLNSVDCQAKNAAKFKTESLLVTYDRYEMIFAEKL